MLVSALLTAIGATDAFAAVNNAVAPLSLQQKKQIEQVIHDYLVNHPEVLVEASQALHKKQEASMQVKAVSDIMAHADALFKPTLTVAGNPKGDVTLVEFFDYQCVHCKKMGPVVHDLVDKNKNLRVIFKEFPIFGKVSEQASRIVLAAALQGKYLALQTALLDTDKPLTEELVFEKAQGVGLNIAQLKTDMTNKSISDELAQNEALAEQIHLMGTPAFIIASTPGGVLNQHSKPGFIPGGASQESLQSLIDQQVKTL